jgi:hypothetical protein
MRKRETENKMAMFLDRLVTIEDLEQFKIELLQEFRGLTKGSPTQSNKKWLKTNEVRKILGISAGKLLTLRVNGTLPYTKIGGVIYYDQEDINQMFTSRKFQHPA